MATQYALIIGVNNYQDFPTLKKAEADARAVADALQSGVLGEFDTIEVLVEGVTAKKAGIAIKRFFTQTQITKDDFLLLFFAGHGHRNIIDEKLYFALEDSQQDFLESTAVDCAHLRSWMKHSSSKKQLILLDCCYSGHFLDARDAGVQPEKSDFINTLGRFAITSAAKNQKAYESIEGSEHFPNSPFTQALLDGLNSIKAINSDGELTARSLHRYIKEQLLTRASSQEPKIFGPEGDNDLILKSRIKKSLPEGLYRKLFNQDPDVRLGSVSRLRRVVKDDHNYLPAAIEVLNQLESKERDRHVYIDLIDLLTSLTEQNKKQDIHTRFSKAVAGSKIKAPLVITSSKIKLPGNVFQDKLKSGGLGPKMVVVPAGEFLMGSPVTEDGRFLDEGPLHEVKLETFALAETTITYNEYEMYCNVVGKNLPDDKGWGKANRPVVNINWDDANHYLQWLSGQTGKIYRLPSEAQ